ncbi:MAG: BamA/TamA family outer membrane protein [Bacteroidetes bacterium]|nr:BamA/TamA family outer membrane protein [Bacteroidota bacterium]
MKRILLFIALNSFLFASDSSAQKDSVTPALPAGRLPFAIADEKKLSDEDLASKKEGPYITGVPDLSSDPLNGLGAGVEAQLFFNGKHTDPFFAYTPYRAVVNLIVFYTTRSQREIRLETEIPYLFNTKWRFHGELGYEVDPNWLYFGITEESLKPLSYFPNGDTTQSLVNNASYTAYENSLSGEKNFYNTYQKEEAILNLIMERSFLEGKARLLFGYELSYSNYTSPLNENSLLHRHALAGKILGYGRNTVPLLQAGLIYDTRDLETDPSNGIFAEYMNEVSLKALGSDFDFYKTFLHFNYYHKILQKIFRKCVFATTTGIGYTIGNAPFFEFQDEESSEKTIEGLGGSETLRGFKQSRFVAPVMEFTNVEFRTRFWQLDKLKQHFSFSAVPFFDVGGVWNSLDRISHTENFRFSEGLGLRIGWNENTTLRFDFAVSKEDKQFFFALVQPF